MTVKTDTIAEYTNGSGVTIDGVLIKDGTVDGVGMGVFGSLNPSSGDDRKTMVWNNDTGAFELSNQIGQMEIVGNALTDTPVYSAELLDANGWTSSGWSGSWAGGWTHTAGNTSALAQSTPAVIATKYQIAITMSGRTAGSIAVSFGGQAIFGYQASDAFGPTATSTAGLTVTPTTDFDGTLLISVKSITEMSGTLATFKSSDGTAKFDIRGNTATWCTFIGKDSGGHSTTGHSNACFGWLAGKYLTTGYYNTIIGATCGRELTTGYFNTLVGESAAMWMTTGYNVTAIGVDAGAGLTTGYNNVMLGTYAGFSVTTGYNNSFLGHYAGNNALQMVAPVNSTAIGANSYTTASNQMVYGDSAITQHLFRGGYLGVGTVSPDSPLHAAGGVAMTGGFSRVANLRADYPALVFNSLNIGCAAISYDFSTAMTFYVNAPTVDATAGTVALVIYNSGNVAVNVGSFGVGILSPLAKAHIKQGGASAAIPVILLEQLDVSEEMIRFTSVEGVGNAIEAVGSKTLTTTHFIKVTINGDVRYISAGTIA